MPFRRTTRTLICCALAGLLAAAAPPPDVKATKRDQGAVAPAQAVAEPPRAAPVQPVREAVGIRLEVVRNEDSYLRRLDPLCLEAIVANPVETGRMRALDLDTTRNSRCLLDPGELKAAQEPSGIRRRTEGEPGTTYWLKLFTESFDGRRLLRAYVNYGGSYTQATYLLVNVVRREGTTEPTLLFVSAVLPPEITDDRAALRAARAVGR